MQLSVGHAIDFIMAICFAIAIVRGWKEGLLIKLAHLAALVVSCAIAHGVATMLKSSIGSKVILPMIEESAGKEALSIPYAKKGITFVADTLAYYLISIVCFFIALFILFQIIKLLHIVDYVPFVGKVNKIGGTAISFLTQVLFLYIICMVIFNVVPQDTLNQWGLSEEVISNTYILKAFVR